MLLTTTKHGLQYCMKRSNSNLARMHIVKIIVKEKEVFTPVILGLLWLLLLTLLHISVPMKGQNAQAPLSLVKVIFPKCLHRALQISHGL